MQVFGVLFKDKESHTGWRTAYPTHDGLPPPSFSESEIDEKRRAGFPFWGEEGKDFILVSYEESLRHAIPKRW